MLQRASTQASDLEPRRRWQLRRRRLLQALAAVAGLAGLAVHPIGIGVWSGQEAAPLLRPPLIVLSLFCLLFALVFALSTRIRGLLPNVLLLLAVLLVLMGASEAALRSFTPQITQSAQLFRFHESLGWELLPGSEAQVVYPGEYTGQVRVNADGLRDKDYPRAKAAGTRRIAVLGDSFTSGLGVDQEQVFTEVLEDELLPGVEVLNFGVNGYGPTQELLVLRDKVLSYQPDHVLLMVYLRNDFHDALGRQGWIRNYVRPQVELDKDGGLQFVNLPLKPPSRAAWGPTRVLLSYQKMHLFRLFENRGRALRGAHSQAPELELCLRETPPNIERATGVMAAAFDEMNRLCQDAGASFQVCLIPTIVQVDPHLWDETIGAQPREAGAFSIHHPNGLLSAAAEQASVPYLDLLPLLQHESDPVRFYYPANKHWTAEGHRWVAETLASSKVIRELSGARITRTTQTTH